MCTEHPMLPAILTCQIFSLLLLDFDLHQKPDSRVLSLTLNLYPHREHANRDRDGKVHHSCRYTFQGQRSPVLTSRLTWWRGEVSRWCHTGGCRRLTQCSFSSLTLSFLAYLIQHHHIRIIHTTPSHPPLPNGSQATKVHI